MAVVFYVVLVVGDVFHCGVVVNSVQNAGGVSIGAVAADNDGVERFTDLITFVVACFYSC